MIENGTAQSRRVVAIGKWLVMGSLSVVVVSACTHVMHMMRNGEARPPAESEFGFGPRSSATSLFAASVEPAEPISVGKLHSWTIRVTNGRGEGVEDATITVDGGMPQHGHGLPSRPRVSKALGGGAYQVEGMKFNMGGWWVVTFHVNVGTASDSITFNLAL